MMSPVDKELEKRVVEMLMEQGGIHSFWGNFPRALIDTIQAPLLPDDSLKVKLNDEDKKVFKVNANKLTRDELVEHYKKCEALDEKIFYQLKRQVDNDAS